MLPFLHLLQTVTPPSEITINVIIGILSFVVASGTNYVVSSKAAGRIEGANAQRFVAIEQRLDSHDTELDQVWSKIGKNSTDVAKLQGQMDRKQSKAQHG